MDFSTIDLTVLTRLPRVQAHFKDNYSGCGCAGDPPGYPSYFVRDYYSQADQPLYRVITFNDDHYQLYSYKSYNESAYKALIQQLWKPLPLDHLRTRLWIHNTYRYFKHCYNGFGSEMVIYPIPSYKKKSYRHDERWKDEFIEAHKAEVDEYNRQLEEQVAPLVTPDNHDAVRIIRQFYPDYVPELDLIESPSTGLCLWWETEAEQPSEAACAGVQRYINKHPTGVTHCQFCGRIYDEQGQLLPYNDPYSGSGFARRS